MTASGLTRAGWAVGAVAVGAPAGGYLLGYAELLLLGLAAAVALAVAGISVCGALPAAAYLDRLPARTQRDTRTSCRLVVRAPERRRSRACTVHVQVGDARVAVTVPALAAGRDWTGPVSLPTGRRGVVTVSAPRLSLVDALGLCRRERTGQGGGSLCVHPVAAAGLPAGLSPAGDGHPAGQPAPAGLTHWGLRDYQPGDDLRRVHWPSSAHTGRLLVRQFEQDLQPGLTLLIDNRPDADPDGFELALDVAATLAVACLSAGAGCEVRFTAGPGWRPANPATARAGLLDLLSRTTVAASGQLTPARRGGAAALAVAVTARPEGADPALLAHLSGLGRPVLVHTGPAAAVTSLAAFTAAWPRLAATARSRARR
ncbi:hypothetical protein GCM10009662_35050 [Catellatospora coxensis]|uniref:DUF58 domain-containing protein n=1 Tax=Catellatospora coxensis TaxID=310354 RepID=UPI0031CF9A62